MKRMLLVAAIVLSFLGSQGAVWAANGDKCTYDWQCGRGAKCVKGKIGTDGVCAGGW